MASAHAHTMQIVTEKHMFSNTMGFLKNKNPEATVYIQMTSNLKEKML